MLPPEVQRIVLLIALAATGYLLILAWFDDQEQSRVAVTYDEAPLAADSLGANGPAASLDPAADLPQPSPANAASTINSDVPDASLLANGAVPVAQPEVGQANGNNGGLVKVTTPTLWVWIDRTGGDIVRVQLPQFPLSLETPDVPYRLLERNLARTYTAQSGLIGPNGTDSKARARYSSSVDELSVGEGEEKQLVLTTAIDGGVARKIFTFRGDDYLVDVEFELENHTSSVMSAALFAQIKRDSLPPDTDESFSLAPQPYLGAAYTTPEERYLKIDFDDVMEERFDATVEGGWVAFLQHYFLAAWVADPERTNRFTARPSADGKYLFGYTGPLEQVAPGDTGRWHNQFYAGPKDQNRLEEIAPNLNLTIDYGFLWWLAMPLFALLDWLHSLVGNWGLAIILLTVVVKVLLLPISAAGYKSMANMRRVAPAMKKLQERYANDREKLSREMMALYKKEGANPLGGCFPMLLPMPIFLALYWVLFESVELRQAPFMLWIDDLAQMDPYFVLPLLMGASTYWMQSLNPQVGDPMQQKMMKMMPIMFTVLFLFFPAGLVLYWLVNNVLSIAQQQYVYKQAEKAQAKA